MTIEEAKNSMKAFLAQKPYSTRSQMIMILLGTMVDCKGGHSKKSVISMIEESRWFDLRLEDRIPYPTVQTKEPRWQTMVAFSRKDCYDDVLFVQDGVRDSWSISKHGINAFTVRKGQFAAGEFDCAKCYMWSPIFKKIIDPSYSSLDRDVDRPENIYKDYYNAKMWEKYTTM